MFKVAEIRFGLERQRERYARSRSSGMEFTCVLPDQEGTIIRFYRNSFLGSVSIKANGQVVYKLSALNPSAHFSIALTRV